MGPVRRLASASLVALAFAVLATANAGGYRFGNGDQAFYVPALLRQIDPALFPRDRALIDAQARLLLLDDAGAAAIRWSGLPLEGAVFAAFAATAIALGASLLSFARAFGLPRGACVAFVLAMALRHRVMDTGVNTFEGYFHPRLLAFALGTAAIGAWMTRRSVAAAALLLIAIVAHPTTALWFAIWLAAAIWCASTPRVRRPAALAAAVAAAATVLATRIVTREWWERMDEWWVRLFDVKDYVFPTQWAPLTWIVHGATAGLVVSGYAWRRRRGVTMAREGAVVAGCLALVAVFLASLPFIAGRLVIAVQLQTSRALWPVEMLATLYVACALVEWPGAPRAARVATARGTLVIACLALAACLRGFFLIHRSEAAVAIRLPADAWTETMTWARTETPVGAHFLVDPGHAWKYGTSFRVGAARDVYFEEVKDVSMALYSRDMARRALDRIGALPSFEHLTREQAVDLARQFDLHYLVVESQPVDAATWFPVVWRNGRFTVLQMRTP